MKSIILSGAAGGIGVECIRRMVKARYVVYAGYMDDWEASELDKLKTELGTDDLIVPVLLDVREPTHIDAVVARVQKENADLAAVVGNGGACPLGVPFEHIDFDITRDTYETNLIGNAMLTQKCVPMLKKSKGRIIFVGSLWGKVAGPMLMSYSASKHAMEAMCDCARRELAAFGIDVIMVNPGLVKNTYMTGTQLAEAKELLRKMGTQPDKLTPYTYDAGRNSKLKHSSPPADLHYQGGYMTLVKMLGDGLHPDKMKIISTAADCADAIMKATTSQRPKPRYIVGGDAKTLIFLTWLLPQRWMDKVMAATS